MAVITWVDVTNHAAELSAVVVAAQTDVLAHVNTALAVAVFGGEAAAKTKLARIYLAAHLGTLSLPSSSGAASGAVIEEKVGDISRKYADASSGTTAGSGLDATVYGLQFKALARTTVARFPLI